jgi:hypothetical protein
MDLNNSSATGPCSTDASTAVEVSGDCEHLLTTLPASEIAIGDIPTLKVAINRHVKNKIARDDSVGWSKATYKFENLELAPDAFIEEVRAGYAFCAWLKGARNSKNFLCMQVLAVDIDSG